MSCFSDHKSFFLAFGIWGPIFNVAWKSISDMGRDNFATSMPDKRQSRMDVDHWKWKGLSRFETDDPGPTYAKWLKEEQK